MGVSHGCNTRDSESLIIRGGGHYPGLQPGPGDILPQGTVITLLLCTKVSWEVYSCWHKDSRQDRPEVQRIR